MSLHASAVALCERGVLFRGASGSGKSSLALAALDLARADGRFGALVGDDRLALQVRHGRLIAEGVAAMAGMAELRGLGVVRAPALARCVIALVVDCDASPHPPTRAPEPDELHALIEGVRLPRLCLTRAIAVQDGARMVLHCLERLRVNSGLFQDFP